MYFNTFKYFQRHHFAQTVAVLHTDGCNIFENLTELVCFIEIDFELKFSLFHFLKMSISVPFKIKKLHYIKIIRKRNLKMTNDIITDGSK